MSRALRPVQHERRILARFDVVGGKALADQRREGERRLQQVVELVGDAAGKRPERGELLALALSLASA